MLNQPPKTMIVISAPWPFMKWGMNIVRKILIALGQWIYMLILTDYFTKWVEAEPSHQVRDTEAKKFIWKNIICRFGVLNEIVTDNGSQFISFRFQYFYAKWNIKLNFMTPRHPQTNGQAESMNITIVNTLKKWLEKAKGIWVDELLLVLWSYRTIDRKNFNRSDPIFFDVRIRGSHPPNCTISILHGGTK